MSDDLPDIATIMAAEDRRPSRRLLVLADRIMLAPKVPDGPAAEIAVALLGLAREVRKLEQIAEDERAHCEVELGG